MRIAAANEESHLRLWR